MKRYTIIFLFFYAINLQAQSQTFIDRTEFKVGYYGNLVWDNGLSLGAEYLWKKGGKIKEKRKGQKTITHQLLMNGSLGFSTNFTSQTDNGLSNYFGVIWRRTNSKGRQLNLELNPLGYYRAFLPDTYEVKGDEVIKVRFPGRSYYAPSIAFGIGKVRKEKTRSGWYLNLNIGLRTPYNAGILPNLSLQYGHRFSFKKK